MVKKSIRIRAKSKGNTVEVKALMSHVMETGLRKNKKSGKKIPAHFIKEVNCEHNGKTVMQAKWGVAVSKNPYLSFKISDALKGDTIKLSWIDNKGINAEEKVPVK
jgi:sulfur-oxidizing protein SoxZ